MTYTQNQVDSNSKTYYYFDREMNQHETQSLSNVGRCEGARFQVNKRVAMYLRLVNNPWVHYKSVSSVYYCFNGLGFVHRFCVICGKNRFEKDSDFSNARIGWNESVYRCSNCPDEFYEEFSSEFHQTLIDKSAPQRIKKLFDDLRTKDGY